MILNLILQVDLFSISSRSVLQLSNEGNKNDVGSLQSNKFEVI